MNLFVLVTHCLQHFFALMLSNLSATFFPEVSHDNSLFNLMVLKKVNEKMYHKFPKMQIFFRTNPYFLKIPGETLRFAKPDPCSPDEIMQTHFASVFPDSVSPPDHFRSFFTISHRNPFPGCFFSFQAIDFFFKIEYNIFAESITQLKKPETFMVRLKDIAQAAGVTSATASTALSGRGRVSADMRERIRKIAREMNYEPNSAALLLKKKSIIDVGFLISDGQISPFGKFTEYCDRHKLRHQLEILSPSGHQTLPLMLKSKIASGVLYSGYVSDPVRAFLRENPDYPFVDIGDTFEYSVHSDFANGAYTAVKYLVELGHRDIALFTGNQDFYVHRQTRKGLEKAAREFELPCGPEIPVVLETPDRYMEHSLKWAEALLAAPKRPTAVFCSGSVNAFALFYTGIRMGLRIPEDFSIISIGDASSLHLQYVPLTTLEHDQEALVDAALEMLFQRIRGEEPEQKERSIPAKFIVRNSTGPKIKAFSIMK